MRGRGRGRSGWWTGLGIVLCAAGLLCALWVLGRISAARLSPTDTIGALSLLIGIVGVAVGALALRVSVRDLRTQRTGRVLAAELASAVGKSEHLQYRQLLGGDDQALNAPIDLRFTLGPVAGSLDVARDGSLRDIGSVYRSLPSGRLVITGVSGAVDDAGTGKTVLAVALILGLVDRRAPDSGEPVPVRLSAAAWPGGTIRHWLQAHLISIYGFKAWEAESLLDEHLVLPVIDGLDEMDRNLSEMAPGGVHNSRAGRLLHEVEDFERPGAKAPVVLTCRHSSYEALVLQLREPQTAVRIEISRLEPIDIRNYLEGRLGYSPQRVARWQPVIDALNPPPTGLFRRRRAPTSPSLVRALNTPWRVTLAAVVYDERDARTGKYLRDPAALITLAERGELYRHLLDRYIAAAVRSPGAATSEPDPDDEDQLDVRLFELDPDTVWRQLALLAAYLNANAPPSTRTVAGRDLSSNDLVLHQLWPLAGRWRPRALGALLASLPMAGVALWTWDSLVSPLLLVSALVVAAIPPVGALADAWPTPQGIMIRRLRSGRGRRRLARRFSLGLAVGMMAWLMFRIAQSSGLSPDYVVTTAAGMSFSLTGLPAVLVAGAAGGLIAAFTGRSDRDRTSTDPRDSLRGDLMSWLGVALLVGLLVTSALGVPVALTQEGASQFAYAMMTIIVAGPLLGVLFGSTFGLVAAFAVRFHAGLYVRLSKLIESRVLPQGITWFARIATWPRHFTFGGPSTLRYIAFLVCMRGKLPRRLGRFLDDCYRVGLLRVAGMAYQFRHRELQDHLATRPDPPRL